MQLMHNNINNIEEYLNKKGEGVKFVSSQPGMTKYNLDVKNKEKGMRRKRKCACVRYHRDFTILARNSPLLNTNR